MMKWIVVAAVIMLSGCATNTPIPSVPIKEYTMQGEVLELDAPNLAAKIKHQAIKGWMGAMTMDYQVRDKQEFATLHVGDQISAKVFVQGEDFWIGQIHPALPHL